MKTTIAFGFVLALFLASAVAEAPPSLTNYQQLYGTITNMQSGTYILHVRINGVGCTPNPCSSAVTVTNGVGTFGASPFKVYGTPGQKLTLFIVNAVGAATLVGNEIDYQAGAVTFLTLTYQGGAAGGSGGGTDGGAGGTGGGTGSTGGTTNAIFDFTISDSGDETVRNGSAENVTIATTLSAGTGQNVTFAVSGLPSGVTPAFLPAGCIVPCTTQLFLAVPANAVAGKTEITVTATNGTLSKITTFDLKILTPMDFVLTQPAARTFLSGTTITQQINVSILKGTPQLISLTASAMPSGLITTLSPISCLPNCTSTLTISGSIAGQYEITIAASSGDDLKRITFPITVTGTETTCTFNWQCNSWASCQNNRQARSCYRVDNCNTVGSNVRVIAADKPAEEQSCTESPPPITAPPSQPPCTSGTKRCQVSILQQCTEGHWELLQSCLGGCDPSTLSCKTATTAPPVQQPTPPSKSWLYYLIGSVVLFAVIVIVLVAILQKRKLVPARDYINKARLDGYSDEQIRKKLGSAGWDEKDLDKLFK